MQQQLPDLGELGVDDRDERGKHGREAGRSHLALHEAAAEQAAPALQVLRRRRVLHIISHGQAPSGMASTLRQDRSHIVPSRLCASREA